jgi:hypothetical protein
MQPNQTQSAVNPFALMADPEAVAAALARAKAWNLKTHVCHPLDRPSRVRLSREQAQFDAFVEAEAAGGLRLVAQRRITLGPSCPAVDMVADAMCQAAVPRFLSQLLLFVALCGGALADGSGHADAELVWAQRSIATFRSPYNGADPQGRVARAQARIREFESRALPLEFEHVAVPRTSCCSPCWRTTSNRARNNRWPKQPRWPATA